MDCLVPSCKCVCHRQYPQEINIKELMLQQIELEYGGKNEEDKPVSNVVPTSNQNVMLLFGNDEIENDNITRKMYGNDGDLLWERRRRLHNGEENPLSHEDYTDAFPKLEDIKKQLGIDELNEDSRPNISSERRRQSTKMELSSAETPSQQYINNKPTKESLVGPKPILLNPLHKLKIKDRDELIRKTYTKALKNVKSLYSKLDENCDQFKEYVNKEADRELEIWMEANK